MCYILLEMIPILITKRMVGCAPRPLSALCTFALVGDGMVAVVVLSFDLDSERRCSPSRR